MKVLEAIQKAFAVVSGHVFVALSSIEIEEAQPNRLVLNINTRLVVADRVTQMISSSGRMITGFGAVESIEVKHWRNAKRFEWWVVSLSLRGNRSVRIGRTADGAEASIAAAHLSTITGKSVSLVAGWSSF